MIKPNIKNNVFLVGMGCVTISGSLISSEVSFDSSACICSEERMDSTKIVGFRIRPKFEL